MQHEKLSSGKWFSLSLAEQLGNIGSEVGRAAKWQTRDRDIFWSSVVRAMELFDMTLMDTRWHGRLIEIGRAREVFADAVLGGKEHKSSLYDLERYFSPFAFMTRLKSGA